ncbi:UNVERIFIED_CONTAM: hypothetical protein FKN15_045554 [Acipenser sinensis]
MKKGGEVKRPAPPAAFSCQEILWLEPHEGELPAMEKGGEVGRPAPPAALSWQEILWLEPHEGQLLATKKGGEVGRPAPPAALSRQEILWLEPHEGQLPAMKKGGRSGDQLPLQQFHCRRKGGRSPTEGSCQPWRPPPKVFWAEEPACARAIGTLRLFGWEEDIPPWPPPLVRCCPCSCAGTACRDCLPGL